MYIERRATIGERLIAFIIDHFVITLIFAIIAITGMISGYILALLLFVPLLYLFKDVVNGQSLGKRAMKIQVQSGDIGDIGVKKSRLIGRNLFIFLWPIEFLALLMSVTSQRIGDKICNTMVVKLIEEEPQGYEELLKDMNDENIKCSNKGIMKVFGIGVLIFAGFALALTIFVVSILKGSGAYEVSIDEIESSSVVETEVGEIISYGLFPTGSINTTNGHGEASLVIKVNGSEESIRVYSYSTKEPGEKWKVNELRILP